MSSDPNTKLMDIEPGGENTQYESIKTITKGSEGNFGESKAAPGSDAEAQKKAELIERGERKAENIRYGQAISEQGYGGETKGVGTAGQEGGFGRTEAQEKEEKDPRSAMGYGEGSGVGG